MSKSNKLLTVVAVVSVILVALSVVIGAQMKPKKAIAPVSVAEVAGVSADDGIKLIAHRGYSAVAPENTVAAAEEAGLARFYGCEFDVRATKDGTWVVMHDDKVSRMTDGRGKITESSADEIEKLIIDSGNGLEKYHGQTVPTFSQMLEVCDTYGLAPVIEIKSGSTEQISELMKILQGYECSVAAYIISFDRPSLEAVRKEYPNQQLWLLVHEITDEVIEYCSSNNMGISFNGNKSENLEFVDDAIAAGITCAAWTIDDTVTASQLYKLGVRFLTTNAIHP